MAEREHVVVVGVDPSPKGSGVVIHRLTEIRDGVEWHRLGGTYPYPDLTKALKRAGLAVEPGALTGARPVLARPPDDVALLAGLGVVLSEIRRRRR